MIFAQKADMQGCDEHPRPACTERSPWERPKGVRVRLIVATASFPPATIAISKMTLIYSKQTRKQSSNRNKIGFSRISAPSAVFASDFRYPKDHAEGTRA